MGINSVSVTPDPGFFRNFSSVNRPNQAKTATARTVEGDAGQAKTKESTSVKVSITAKPSQTNPANPTVVFDVDPKSKDVVIKFLNKETGEEIRQMPTEDALRLSQRIGEFQEKLLDLG